MAATPARPATYLPRAEELRKEVREFSDRVRGFQQDILDFKKIDDRFRQVLADYRRVYPDGGTRAEEDIIMLYSTLQPAFVYFTTNLRPKEMGCLQTISRIDSMNSMDIKDVALSVEVTRKLCKVDRELTRF